MDYKATLDFLYNSLPMYQREGKAAYKSDLENSLAFDKYLGQSHQKYHCIHVAGTNGKGSVSHMLAAILQTAGYKVGLYTSPHLKSYRERIKVNGKKISKDYVTQFIEQHMSFIKKTQPSFFEMTVFMGFEYFKDQAVDIAIIETGMGGRLDSTNVIQPVLSLITNIGLDHVQFLGSNKASIAKEKAGIIKTNTPVVIGESQTESNEVFVNTAKEKQASINFADQKYKVDYVLNNTEGKPLYHIVNKVNNKKEYAELELDLRGSYQGKNILTVLAALDILASHWTISETDIREGLKHCASSTGLMGRWQIIGHNPQIICDTGHNIDGVQQILTQLNNTAYRHLHMVWGMVNDKSIDEILALLPKENCSYYFTKADIPRAFDASELYKKAQEYGLKGQAIPKVKEALEEAQKQAHKTDLIFIGGSTFVVAEIV